MTPIYAVVHKGERTPNEQEFNTAISSGVKSGGIQRPAPGARTLGIADPDMDAEEVDGAFLISVAENLLKVFPDLAQYVTVAAGKLESSGLRWDFSTWELDTGVFRVVTVHPE